ncbi:unnamed protein product [Urochloa decumbens]|uniref:No apical meristem-associated C-terminal domain-containing protein n=1 Tax=Urochloa decumbens TaxID=240449 RepID=A0ABC9AM06_9POAL
MPYSHVSSPNGSQLPENFHFVGGRTSKGTPSPNGSGLAMDGSGTDVHETIDIDADDNLEPTRTDKRLNWSHDEDVRLVSAWLHNSLDPVDGNDKKSDYYWADVTATYNSTTPKDFSPKERPIGHKKAKDECNGKRKAPVAISAIGEKLDKFIEASTKAEKITEAQESLANKKLEVAKLNHKAAQEQTKGKMLDLYKDLLCGSTSDLSEETKAERSKALECMRLALFANPN